MLKKLQWTIGIVAFLLLVNLVCTVTSLDHSFMYFISATDDNNASETIKDFKDSWAIRGQMGDILSGHFSALAFLAVAFSILLQNEANRKMQTSIEKQDKALEQQEKSLQQQSKALEVQSESLKAQIDELQQSRKESERQTEEFFIANMNVKLDRYYKLLDSYIEIVNKGGALKSYKRIIEGKAKGNTINDEWLSRFNNEDIPQIEAVIRAHNHIMNEITDLSQSYSKAHESFLEEFAIKTMNDALILDINKSYKEELSLLYFKK